MIVNFEMLYRIDTSIRSFSDFLEWYQYIYSHRFYIAEKIADKHLVLIQENEKYSGLYHYKENMG